MIDAGHSSVYKSSKFHQKIPSVDHLLFEPAHKAIKSFRTDLQCEINCSDIRLHLALVALL